MEVAFSTQCFPLLDLRVACTLLLDPFFSTGVAFDSLGSDRRELLFVTCFFAGGSGEDSVLGRLDLPLGISSGTSASSSVSSGDESLGAGCLAPLFRSFLTAGVLGFFAGAPFFTGVALDTEADSFLGAAGLLANFLEDGAFLTGDFFPSGRVLPLDFDRLAL